MTLCPHKNQFNLFENIKDELSCWRVQFSDLNLHHRRYIKVVEYALEKKRNNNVKNATTEKRCKY